LIYTIGPREVYDRHHEELGDRHAKLGRLTPSEAYLHNAVVMMSDPHWAIIREPERGYRGGCVFQSIGKALLGLIRAKFDREYGVYGVGADWDADTVAGHGNEEFGHHDLLVTSRIVTGCLASVPGTVKSCAWTKTAVR